MSTPEERIRKAVEEKQQEKSITDAKARREEAAREHSLKLLWQRAGTLGEKCKVRARRMADASERLVYVFLEMHKGEAMDPGFFLSIGRPTRGMRGIRLVPKGDGWEVTIHDGGTQSRTFQDDAHFEGKLDEILEPLVTAAALAVVNEQELPREER